MERDRVKSKPGTTTSALAGGHAGSSGGNIRAAGAGANRSAGAAGLDSPRLPVPTIA